jgi:hypothetical protein
MFRKRREVGSGGDLRGYDARDTISDVGVVPEEEEVDTGKANERVDVEEENAVEDGNACHLELKRVKNPRVSRSQFE